MTPKQLRKLKVNGIFRDLRKLGFKAWQGVSCNWSYDYELKKGSYRWKREEIYTEKKVVWTQNDQVWRLDHYDTLDLFTKGISKKQIKTLEKDWNVKLKLPKHSHNVNSNVPKNGTHYILTLKIGN